jgi:spore coat protein CotH
MYDDAALRTFEIEIAAEDWTAMQAEYAAAVDPAPYHPIVFKHMDDVVTNAMIRLRANPLHWASQAKMQFQISFNEIDPERRYAGLRKLVLDSAHYNRSHLRDRLAASIFQDLGLPFSCVNHARLFVNGQYYGLYSNIEKVDHEFLERAFDDHDGLLYKKGQELTTHEDEQPDTSRKDLFWQSTTPDALATLGDVDQMVGMWAVESIVPDGDGYWAGGWNMYLYDHPSRGFLYIPYDFDLAFDSVVSSADPAIWHKENERYNGRPHVEAILADPVWLGRFAMHVADARAAYDPAVLQARIDRWAAQIADAVAVDPNAPFTWDQHVAAVARLRGYVGDRAAFLRAWAACWEAGGTDTTGDRVCDP